MSTYICEKCGCIDNTSCNGNYWMIRRNEKYFKEDWANNMMLCSECTPKKYDDNSESGGGEWHNYFPKKHWNKFGTKDEIIEKCKEGNGDFINAIDYFDKHK